jgi:CBS domain-containing protein
MRCKDIMKSQIACVTPRDTVQTAARKMRDERVGFLPVCDTNNTVLGTVTDRDLVLRAVANNRPLDATIDSVMTPEVVACRPEDDVRRAEQLMAQNKKSRVLCTDANGRLLGVISLSDIAHNEPEQQRVAETMRQVTSREVRA